MLQLHKLAPPCKDHATGVLKSQGRSGIQLCSSSHCLVGVHLTPRPKESLHGPVASKVYTLCCPLPLQGLRYRLCISRNHVFCCANTDTRSYCSKCLDRTVQAHTYPFAVFQINCLRRMCGISWRDHVPNVDMLTRCKAFSAESQLQSKNSGG